MAKIYNNARRFTGTDWDAWAGASNLPSGDLPAIFEKEEATAVLCGGDDSSTVTVALTYMDGNDKFPYYSIIRTADETDGIGSIEEIETEQTDLFNKIARSLDAGQSPERAAAYYGLELIDIM